MKYNIGDRFVGGINSFGEKFEGEIIGIEERDDGFMKYLIEWSDADDGYFDERLLDTIVNNMKMDYLSVIPKNNLPEDLFEI